MNNIHSTAIVSENAKLGDNIEIGPYAIIQDDVEIGNDCYIGPHAVLYNGARIGDRVKIHQAASIANAPQDLKYKNEKTYFYVGDDTTIREYVTLNRGTSATGFSKVGKNCLFMAYSHVAHDCVIGDNCIIANGVQIAGHVTVEDWVIVGGMSPIHQFCIVGQHAMIGGGFRATVDVPPFVTAAGSPLRFTGLNSIGLKRRGFSNEDISSIKTAYDVIYNSGLNVSQAKEKLKNDYADNEFVKTIIEFLDKSKRGIVRK